MIDAELVTRKSLLIMRDLDALRYHVLVESGEARPADYHASFLRLADLGVYDREFAQRIARCAGLRNRLVHEYEELDPSKVFDALQTAMSDVPAYLARVTDFVTRSAP